MMFMAATEVKVMAKKQNCSWKPPYHPRSHKVSHPRTNSSHFHKALIPYAHVLCDHVSAAETDREGGRGGDEYRRFMKSRWRKGQKWSWSVMMLAVTLDCFPFSPHIKKKQHNPKRLSLESDTASLVDFTVTEYKTLHPDCGLILAIRSQKLIKLT